MDCTDQQDQWKKERGISPASFRYFPFLRALLIPIRTQAYQSKFNDIILCIALEIAFPGRPRQPKKSGWDVPLVEQ